MNSMEVHEEKQLLLNANNVFFTSLIAGGLAGSFVDIILFPIDTLKTRMQSECGFPKSGGFSNLYKGLTPAILGSAPTAALFFITYESTKLFLIPKISQEYSYFIHMGAASFAETVSCLIRVPVEIVKQRKQAQLENGNCQNLNIKLFYKGYWSTVLRDVPFSLIQFPIWEYFKKTWSDYTQKDIFPFEGAICGAAAGSIAAALTTPFDVAKTRIMLFNKNKSDLAVSNVIISVYRSNGIQGFFAGLTPRVIWISIGGFIFFGVYEKSKAILSS